MPKKVEKRQEARSFSFRMPGGVYDDLAAVARARGVDVSGILNWILAEFHPTLLEEKSKHETALLAAAESSPWKKMDSPAEALRCLRDLIAQLHEEYEALSKRVLREGERRAG